LIDSVFFSEIDVTVECTAIVETVKVRLKPFTINRLVVIFKGKEASNIAHRMFLYFICSLLFNYILT